MKATLAASLALLAGLDGGGELTPENFEKVYRTVRPHGDEVWWSEVPWLLDGREARKRAAEEGKPILVWTMSGMPLGSS